MGADESGSVSVIDLLMLCVVYISLFRLSSAARSKVSVRRLSFTTSNTFKDERDRRVKRPGRPCRRRQSSRRTSIVHVPFPCAHVPELYSTPGIFGPGLLVIRELYSLGLILRCCGLFLSIRARNNPHSIEKVRGICVLHS